MIKSHELFFIRVHVEANASCCLLQAMQLSFGLRCISKKCWIIYIVCISNHFSMISSTSCLFLVQELTSWWASKNVTSINCFWYSKFLCKISWITNFRRSSSTAGSGSIFLEDGVFHQFCFLYVYTLFYGGNHLCGNVSMHVLNIKTAVAVTRCITYV